MLAPAANQTIWSSAPTIPARPAFASMGVLEVLYSAFVLLRGFTRRKRPQVLALAGVFVPFL